MFDFGAFEFGTLGNESSCLNPRGEDGDFVGGKLAVRWHLIRAIVDRVQNQAVLKRVGIDGWSGLTAFQDPFTVSEEEITFHL